MSVAKERQAMASGILNNGVSLTWYGHSTVLLTSPRGKRIMIDPFVHSNPSCPEHLHNVTHLDALLITHGHSDHMGDALKVVETGRPKHVVAVHEIAEWLASKGVKHTSGMNRGGSQTIDGIKVTLTQAFHSSTIEDSGELVALGEACGIVVEMENGFRVYHAGDTDLFGDMALLGELWRPDLALLPIGDHYTMNPEMAARAARLLGVKRVVPIHYGTFPVLTGTPDRLRAAGAADGLEVIELKPGETLS
jgi:L-ascorbate metabolism protein UlaG (beta-lactamase superfamily)